MKHEIKDVSLLGERAYGFNEFRPLKDKVFPGRKEIVPEKAQPTTEDLILDKIFCIDPVTQRPRGDLAIFLNDNANPEIKDFIQRNLLFKNGDSDAPSTSGISDDDLAELTRGYSEPLETYQKRVVDFIRKYEETPKDEKKVSDD